jgi:uncharacterized protein YegJ (DUF2314 family)
MRKLLCLLALAASTIVHGQNLTLPPPEDLPKINESNEAYVAFERAAAPYLAKARETYPDAKRRFLSGQLGTRPFFVSVRLAENGRYENSFVRVLYIDEKSGDISGKIANEIQLLRNYRYDQRIIVHEADIRDWTIANPDGTQEGNLVGRFTDNYRP